jgi:hypothetical protein
MLCYQFPDTLSFLNSQLHIINSTRQMTGRSLQKKYCYMNITYQNSPRTKHHFLPPVKKEVCSNSWLQFHQSSLRRSEFICAGNPRHSRWHRSWWRWSGGSGHYRQTVRIIRTTLAKYDNWHTSFFDINLKNHANRMVLHHAHNNTNTSTTK